MVSSEVRWEEGCQSPIWRPPHADARMHQKVLAFGGADQAVNLGKSG
jgi:hypothetical protein